MTDNTTTKAAEAIETADAAESDAEDTNQALAHARLGQLGVPELVEVGRPALV